METWGFLNMKKYILTESQIRNLVSGFVDEAKGDTKYTPEYLEKIKEKYKGKPFRDFEKGEDKLVYTHVYRQGKDFLNDFTKDMIRTKRPNYTDDELRDIAKKYKGKPINDFRLKDNKAYRQVADRGTNFYMDFTKDMIKKLIKCTDYTKKEIRDIAKKCETKTEFQKKYYCAFKAALDFGPFLKNSNGEVLNTREFYNSVTSHLVINNLSKRLVYVFEFYDENKKPVGSYIGLTFNSKQRKESHETGINFIGKEVETSVSKFIKDNPKYTYVYNEKTDYIDAYDAQKMEEYWKNEYFMKGWDILNIAPTGGLGKMKKSLKQIKKDLDYVYDIEGTKTLKDLIKKHEHLYNAVRRMGLHDPKNKDFILSRFKRSYDIYKTDDEIINDVKKYKTYNDFCNDIILLKKIKDRKLLKKVKELFAQKEQEQPIE